MAATACGWGALAAITAAVVATRGVAGGSVLPFPAGALPGWGAAHTLCSLQCELREPASFTVLDVPVTRNDSVCHSPVATDSLPGGADGNEVYPGQRQLSVRVRRIASRPGRPSGSLERDTEYYALPLGRLACAGEDGRSRRLVGEPRVADFLTLTRASIGGAVTRVNGQYEVLGVTRFTVGVCADTRCTAVVAVDMAAPSAAVPCGGAPALGVPCAFGGTPVLTYTGPDGVARPVGIGRHDLLSLGRAVLGRHDWLGAAAAAALRVASEVRVLNPQAALLPAGVAPPTFTGTAHRLNGTPPTLLSGGAAPRPASGGTIWLDAVAWVLCAGRRRVYALDAAVCDGVAPFIPARQAQLDGETVTLPGVLEEGSGAWLRTVWLMVPDVVARASAPPDAPLWVPGPTVDTTVTAAQGPRLPFLTARGLRELNPDSAEERALAAALGRRTVLLPVSVRRNLSMGVSAAVGMFEPALDDLNADLRRLSATFDSSVWGEAPPDPPIAVATVVLAGVVFIAELGVLASLFIGTASWDLRAAVAFSVAAVMGAAALGAFVSQYVLERGAAGWRVAAVRDNVLAQLTGGANLAALRPDLRGTVVVRSETLLLCARNGYHVARMLALMAAAIGCYGVVAAALLVCTWRCWRWGGR